MESRRSGVPKMLPGEWRFREWLVANASQVLEEVGLTKGHTALDYGCGSGTFTAPAARIVGEEGKVYALDTRLEALNAITEKARSEGLNNIEVVLLDSQSLELGLQDASVDAVLLYDVIHVMEDKEALLSELHRVLRGGDFLSIFPMHVGTEKMLEIVNKSKPFILRDRLPKGDHKTASEIINLKKL